MRRAAAELAAAVADWLQRAEREDAPDETVHGAVRRRVPCLSRLEAGAARALAARESRPAIGGRGSAARRRNPGRPAA